MNIVSKTIYQFELDMEEAEQLYRMARNECKDAGIVERTTNEIYNKLKPIFEHKYE